MNGVLNVDKPAGITSAAVVGKVKRLLPRGTKIGHAGTLDPFATGVLLLLIGKATKSCEAMMGQPKGYDATVKFGATTATDDLEGEESPVLGAVAQSIETVQRATAQFTGDIYQRPPAFSAMKIQGRRAYDLARKGEPVELKPRLVRVDRIEILSYTWPLLRLRIDCGRGTYIRAIARDLGDVLHVGGYLTELRRTRIGPFTSDAAMSLATLAAEGVERFLQPAIMGM